MKIQINGQPRELPDGTTVAGAVAASGAPALGRGTAAAVDGHVVPRGEWETTTLEPGQRVEVLQAVQGG